MPRCVFPLLVVATLLGMPRPNDSFAQDKPAAGKPNEAAPGKAKPHKLPADKKATVVSLDYRGGFTPPRLNASPTLSILADGTVLIPKNYEGQKAFEGKLAPDELQELLDFIVVKNEFFAYDPKAVQAKLNKGGPRPIVADAATVVIKVSCDDTTKEASQYALGFGSDTVKEVGQLVAIKNRLERVRSVIQLGGPEKLAKWVDLANKQLKADFPQVKPLSADDLQSGGERVDNSYYVHFSRTVVDAGAKPPTTTVTTAFVNQPAAGEPRVSVSHNTSSP